MRIGVFGGTFNPIHNGHVLLAKSCADSFQLDRVYVIPTMIPPHKATETLPSAEHRLAFCRLAFSGDERFTVSDIEIRRGGVSYTVDTLREIKSRHPDDELFLIMGSDMFFTLKSWRNPQDIFSLVSILTAPRHKGELEKLNVAAEELKKMGASALICSLLPLPLSSTEIREGSAGFTESIPPASLDYIRQNGLYGFRVEDYPWPVEHYIEIVRKKLRDKRFHHSMMVAEEAKKLAARYGENENLAYVAGVVHDILKESPPELLLQILDKSAIIHGNTLVKHPKVWHGFAASAYIQWELSIYNTQIISAVKYHSTGHANMTQFEKIIYLADLVSCERCYNGVEEMRSVCYENLDQAMLKALSFQITDLVSRSSPVYDESFQAYNFYAEVLA